MTLSEVRRPTAPRPSPPGVLPPWLWLWLVLYAVNLPATIDGWRAQVTELLSPDDIPAGLPGTPSLLVLRLFAIVGLVPSFALFVGALTVCAPHLRAWWVERRLRLVEDHRPVIAEMQAFVDEYAPEVRIRANPLRSGRLARIYPAGWRGARIAVFGPMVTLWRRDPEAARAVLLHEISHHRNGDHLIVGLGSPFVGLVNAWLPAFVLFGLVPLVVLFAQDYPTATPLTAQVVVLVTQVPRLLLLPVAALWLAELAADRYVVDLGGGTALARQLSARRGRSRGLRARLAHLSHPPSWLRGHVCGRPGVTGLLVAWPLLWIGQLLLALVGAVPGWRLLGHPWHQTWTEAFVNSREFVIASIPAWAAAVALIVVWPVVGRLWTSLWTGRRTPRPAAGTRWAGHARAAALPASLLVCGLVLTGCVHATEGTPEAAAVSSSDPTSTVTTTTEPTTTTDTTTSTPSDTQTTSAEDDPDSSTEDTSDDTSQDDDAPTGSYDVTISGTVSGHQFQRSATLKVVPVITTVGTTNGVNDVDVCLVSGSPAAQPAVGAIWFGSNSACDPGAGSADIDLGYVTVDGTTITVKPDEKVAATLGNNFTSSAGIAACLYAPVSGSLSIRTDGGSVSGSLDVSGYGGAMCGNSAYQATVTGS